MDVHGHSTCDEAVRTVNVFLSYAHEDRVLLDKLTKHLSSLRKASLLIDWCDRLIAPGMDWQSEIAEAISKADIILLLLSPDFFNSEYCDLESQLAIDSYRQKRATVLPILLRPVVWRDAKFASLQSLPSGGKPVTDWRNHDKPFSEIAGTIRGLILDKHFAKRAAMQRPLPASRQRFLDTATSSVATINELTDLVVMVRTANSDGLRSALKLETSYSVSDADVTSGQFEVAFPGTSEDITSKSLEIAIEAPTFELFLNRKTLVVPAEGDSPACVFMLTPKALGPHRLDLEILDNGTVIFSRPLKINVVANRIPSEGYNLNSVPLLRTGSASTNPFTNTESLKSSEAGTITHSDPTPEPKEQPATNVVNRLRIELEVQLRLDEQTSAVSAKVRSGKDSRLEVVSDRPLPAGHSVLIVSEGRSTEVRIGNATVPGEDAYSYVLEELPTERKSTRSEIRLQTNVPATIREAESGFGFSARVVDVSPSGIAFELSQPFPPGVKLCVEFEGVLAAGEVRHCHKTESRGFVSGIKVDQYLVRTKPQSETATLRSGPALSSIPTEDNRADLSARTAASLSELRAAEKEFAKGTIAAAERLLPLVRRLQEVVEKDSEANPATSDAP